MDLNMPFMDGNQATQEIRDYLNSTDQQQPYIVAITGHSEDVYRESAMKRGIDDFITKPATKEQIKQILL